MPMFKAAQMNFTEDLVISLPIEAGSGEEEVVVVQDLPEMGVELEMSDPEVNPFKLPLLPGADDIIELMVEEGEDAEDTSAETKEEKKSDKSDKEVSPKEFVNWVQEFISKIPKHKGETVGVERAMAYLKRGLGMLGKIVQQDFDGEIDIAKAEDARIEMEEGIGRLEKELNKRRKKANQEDGMEKSASTRVGGIIVTVPLIVSSIARTCINSTVSGGKDIEDTFHRLASKYSLTDREKMEVVQLLADMNFPMKRDMGFMVDDKEEFKYTSTDNYNFPAGYQS